MHKGSQELACLQIAERDKAVQIAKFKHLEDFKFLTSEWSS